MRLEIENRKIYLGMCECVKRRYDCLFWLVSVMCVFVQTDCNVWTLTVRKTRKKEQKTNEKKRKKYRRKKDKKDKEDKRKSWQVWWWRMNWRSYSWLYLSFFAVVIAFDDCWYFWHFLDFHLVYIGRITWPYRLFPLFPLEMRLLLPLLRIRFGASSPTNLRFEEMNLA